MSRENVEIVKRVQPDGVDMVELFGGPVEADFGATAPDPAVFETGFAVEFIASPAGTLRTGSSGGVEGLAAAWREWLEPWESYHVEVEELIDAGDEVVTLVRVRARTTRDSVVVEHRPAAVWSVRGGKVAAVRFYLHRAEALKAVGLAEPPEG